MNADETARAGSNSLVHENEAPPLPAERKDKLLTIDSQASPNFQRGGFVKHIEADNAGVSPDGVEDQTVAGTENGNGVCDGIHLVLAGRMVALSFLAISGERSARIAWRGTSALRLASLYFVMMSFMAAATSGSLFTRFWV